MIISVTKTDNSPRSIAHDCLALAAKGLERISDKTELAPAFGIMEALEAAILLDFPDIVETLEPLHAKASLQDPLKHAISNIERYKEKLARPQNKIRSTEDLDHEYPIWTEDYLPKIIRQLDEKHLNACLIGKGERAVDLATRDIDRSDVANAMLVLGHIDEAIALFPNRPDPFDLVLAIELFRRQRREDALSQIDALVDIEYPGMATQLALGIAGRIPWQIYPFSDW